MFTTLKCLLSVTLLISSFTGAKSQEIDYTDTTSFEDFRVRGFELVYGNSSYSIHNFSVRYAYTLLATRQKAGGATFLLLDESNLPIDELFIKSGPVDYKIWRDGQTYYYCPFFFYKSELCDLDYKSGIASFRVVDSKKLEYIECTKLDDRYIRNELFEATKNFKITFLDKEKKNKTRIGFAVNDKYVERRSTKEEDEYAPLIFPYAELNDTLYVLDTKTKMLYTFPIDLKYSVSPTIIEENEIDSARHSEDILNSKKITYHTDYLMTEDEHQNKIYLLVNHRIRIKGKGRKKTRFVESQNLYKLQNNMWVKVKFNLPTNRIYKLQIVSGRIYVIFEISDSYGNSSKMLYKSKERIPASVY